MNIGEANAVNCLVQALTGRTNHLGEQPSVAQQQVAVDLLIKGAHKAIGAGLRPGEVTVTAPTLADAIKRLADGQDERSASYIAAARHVHQQDGEVEFDDPTVTSGSEGDGGDFVLAWVWVSNEDAGLVGGDD